LHIRRINIAAVFNGWSSLLSNIVPGHIRLLRNDLGFKHNLCMSIDRNINGQSFNERNRPAYQVIGNPRAVTVADVRSSYIEAMRFGCPRFVETSPNFSLAILVPKVARFMTSLTLFIS